MGNVLHHASAQQFASDVQQNESKRLIIPVVEERTRFHGFRRAFHPPIAALSYIPFAECLSDRFYCHLPRGVWRANFNFEVEFEFVFEYYFEYPRRTASHVARSHYVTES